MDRKGTASAFGWLVVSALFTKILVPLTTIYFARKLGANVMGIYFVAWNILTIAEIFRDGGLTQTFIADQGEVKERLRTYSALCLLSALIPAILLLAVGGALPKLFGIEPQDGWVILSLSGILAVNAFLTLPLAQLQREGRFKEVGKAESIASVVSAVVALILVEAGFGLTSLMAMLWIRASLLMLLVNRWHPFVMPRWSRGDAADILRRSRTILASVLMYSPFSLIDGMLVAAKLGTVPNGWYGNARNLAMKPAELLSFPLGRTLYVAYSKRLDDSSKFAEVLARSLTVATLLALPVYGFLGVFAEEVTVLLFGPEWKPSGPIFAIFCLHYAIRSIGTLGGSALTAAGKAGIQVWIWLATYVLIGIAIWLKWRSLNVIDVAWIFCAGAAFTYALQVIVAIRMFPPPTERATRFFRALGLALAASALLALLKVSGLSPTVALGIGALLSPPIYLIGAGLAFAGKPFAYLSPKGVKNLYQSL